MGAGSPTKGDEKVRLRHDTGLPHLNKQRGIAKAVHTVVQLDR
jgi:hypothetical protein